MEIYVKLICSFIVLLLLTRLMGKKQTGQLTYFNYITGITLGSLTAAFVSDSRISLLHGLGGIALWAAMTLLLGFINIKSRAARLLIDGEPTVIIRNGRIREKALRKIRLSIDDVIVMLRQKEAFTVHEVDCAIMEPNGKLSVYKKTGYQPAEKRDVQQPNADAMTASHVPAQLISDGKPVKRNLDESGLSESWLKRQLEMTDGPQAEIGQFFYAEIDAEGTLHAWKSVETE